MKIARGAQEEEVVVSLTVEVEEETARILLGCIVYLVS
jgi:hypothetical protein